jgi:LmbE family N-acetylglucosaminyl deacetylase
MFRCVLILLGARGYIGRVKIVVISAHRGDAALSVGLAVDLWLQRGDVVEVISCFTRSEYAPFSDAGSLHPNDRMSFVSATRKREDGAWVKLAGKGVSGKLLLTDLNLKDAPLRLHCAADEVFGQVTETSDKATLKIRKAVDQSKAELVVVPLALDGHIDRVTARDAASAGQTVPVLFYEDLPQALKLSEEFISDSAKVLLASPQFVQEPTDADAAIARKRRIAWCYDSQIDEAETAAIAERSRGFGGRERLWAVR